ncbi:MULTISPECIES: NAD(P)-dependent alcohol dehydrogenase [unclassified Fusibacter]|uniref:NAD(P)-dependent alcohol dehydrogenase n=1 Tax=unclassified Fusibacter TaxID=2624464 RepID=UPI00101166BE|nr:MULTISPECIES: NAD(P)-dependent alcohol dehydrogenase [unclassified Fusibacter]MCK8058676.1 NAD(P)-dependent alcohol dehydrogenase [Fusibacter sp. A2]NPE21751.1 NAD(P)-dependent alcohol dehydrogenase [Fusibacter sp. A1]RXV61325.1 NAD(P)-dependent alcohol dehydrogenase [Fusibacter sp. A1]
MKAIITTKYGAPDVLKVKEIAVPVIKSNEMLIKVKATTVTQGDCEMRSFKMPMWLWLPLRLYMGVFKPRVKILGQEVSGIVEKVGKEVSKFRVGDEIFATTDLRLGAYAEYIVLPEEGAIAIKPKSISFEEAAAIPVGGLNALHYMSQAQIQEGQKVLIYGSTGSIGTVAVQLAKYYGAEVTAVCSTEKIELVKSMGADKVIDYKKEDFTENGERYDVVFETVGKTDFNKNLASVKDGGYYLIGNPVFADFVNAKKLSKKTGKHIIAATASYQPAALEYLCDLYKKGHIRSIIDRTYPLEEMVEAHTYVELGRKSGNVVIRVEHEGN